MTSPQLDPNLALHASLFHNPGAFSQWENHLQYAHGQTQFDIQFTGRWVAAINTFREILGESFLRQVGYAHPLIRLFDGTAPWQAERQIQFADFLRYLKNKDPHFEPFRRKLLSPVKAEEEAMDFLRLGHLFRSAGLDLSFPVEVKTHTTPDIVLTDPDTGQEIIVEVSRMDESEGLQKCHRDYDRLHRTLNTSLSNPVYSAIQFQLTPKEYPAALAPKLATLQETVETTNEPADYTDDYFSIRMYPATQLDNLYTWTNEANRRKGFNGIPLDVDETRRISGNKIKREARQLPATHPGLIIIPVSAVHFWQQRVTETTSNFQARMKNLSHILGIYIFAEALHPDADQFRFNSDDRFNRVSIADALTRYSLFVSNPVFNLRLRPDTHKKLLDVLSPSKS